MQITQFKKSLRHIVCIVLIAAMALLATGCANSKAPAAPSSGAYTAQPDGSVLGQGSTQFTFSIVDGEGKETTYTIKTDKQIVGDALIELGLIDGESSDYGLYVKTVNGLTFDYDTHKKYWAFYVNDDYALSGVDSTEIAEGSKYTFKVE